MANAILQETSDYLLQETGDKIILDELAIEGAAITGWKTLLGVGQG